MGGGWGCPHEMSGACSRVGNRPCDPGMKGCVLAGRFRFSNPDKNRPPAGGVQPADEPATQESRS